MSSATVHPELTEAARQMLRRGWPDDRIATGFVSLFGAEFGAAEAEKAARLAIEAARAQVLREAARPIDEARAFYLDGLMAIYQEARAAGDLRASLVALEKWALCAGPFVEEGERSAWNNNLADMARGLLAEDGDSEKPPVVVLREMKPGETG